MIKKTPVVLTLAIMMLSQAVVAQSPKEVLKWMNTAEAVNKNFYYEIPFEYRNDHIIIKVNIGNELYDYVFDTGGYNDITDVIQHKNNFPVLTTQTVGSANRLKSSVNIVKVDSLSIGSLVFKDIAALQMNFENLPSMCGINGALIGASIIKNYAWHIDFPQRKIIVTDDFSKLPLLPNSIKIPVTFNERLMPFIEMALDGKTSKFMFDLGSATLLNLTEKTAGKYKKDKKLIEVDGAGIEGGNGVIKAAVTIFKANTLAVDGTVLFTNKPVVYTKSANENLIGNPIIKSYIVTLNFKSNELYLSPIAGNTTSDGWTSFGMNMEYKNNRLSVTAIFNGLAAQQAGIQLGDEILAINGQVITCKNFCACKQILDQTIQNSASLTLRVNNKQGSRDITLQKEKVF